MLNLKLINIDNDPNILNENCGAEFVHKEQKIPLNFDSESDAGKKCLSFDGDADR